ncbi:MAG: hypothetical protein ACRDMH_11480 [Solirubrobacterales bacterium]
MVSRRRNYKAEYRRRQRLARGRGFTSYAQQRRFSPKIGSARDLGRLPESARGARSEALHVVQVARERGISIEEAARQEGVAIEPVRWWARDALKPKRVGKTLPSKGDRLLRLYPVFLAGEPDLQFVEIRGSNAARRAQRVFDVQYRFIEGNASVEELRSLTGQRVAGRLVESDPERLEAIGERGGVDIPEAYREVLG